MPNFKVRLVGGRSSGTSQQSGFVGIGGSMVIEAKDRVDAYIIVARQLSEQGAEVTVLDHVTGLTTPLGFTPDEWEIIRQAGVPMTPGYPKDGYQIEQIVQVEE